MTPRFLVLAVQFIGLQGIIAEDWPTYQHDNRRSGVTSEELAFPLAQTWHYQSPTPPRTAWSGPAKWDAYSENKDLQSMRNFDPAFYVTIVQDAVYFGSSVDNAAHCLDAKTGEERWVHFTNSAVRLPPTIHDGRAYFGSDDGRAYAVDATNGKLLWKHQPSKDPRMVPSNGKYISVWPVRTGVLVQGNRAYFGASLLPWEPTYLCALDALTGKPHYVQEETGITLQGAFLASTDQLYAPQGRSVPLVYQSSDGKRLGGIAGSGGVYCVLTEDEQFISMPSSQKEKEDTVRIADGNKRQTLVSFGGANRMIVAGPHAYSHQGTKLKVIDRAKIIALQAEIDVFKAANEKREKAKKVAKDDKAAIAKLNAEIKEAKKAMAEIEARKPSCELWAKESPQPIGFMLAGRSLFLGGDGSVRAVHADTGESLWEAKVQGKAYGLAAANGYLLVSTDLGHIYCFQSAS